MDIFFCDLCGARVSDADLRAGHGTRRRWDVICRACLEQDKGQAWLNVRAGVQPGAAAAVAAAAPSAPAGTPPSSAAAVLDAPRDRARTLEEDEEPSPVAAQQIEQIEADVIEDHSVTTAASREELAAKAGTTDPQLSSAAGTFAQLASDRSEGGKPRADLDDDDLVGDGLPGGITPTPAPAVSPFAFDAPGAAGGKDETARVAEAPAKSPSGIRAKPASGVRAKSSPSSSRVASGRSAKSTSGRIAKPGRRGGQDNSRMILIGTGVSALILIAVMIGIAVSGHKPTAKKITTDPSKDLVAHIESTRTVVLDALRSPKDVPKLQQALERLQQTQTEVDAFQNTASKLGLSEDEVGRILEQRCHWPSLYSQSRTLREYIQAAHN